MKKARRKYGLDYFAFTGPILMLFALFFLYPLIQSIFYSFTNWNGVSFTKLKGWDNYVFIFTKDADFWHSFQFTALYTLASAAFCNVGALLLARALTSGIRGENKLRIAFFLPNILSVVIVGIIWSFIYGQISNELYARTALRLFGLPWLDHPLLSVVSIALAQTWSALGWYTLIYISGYQGIPNHLYEACCIDGCTGVSRFFRITLPLLMPTITVCLFTTLTQGLQVFDLIYSMTSGGPGKMTESVVMNIYNTSFVSMFYGFGSAKTVVLSLVILAVGFGQVLFTRRLEVEM